MKKVVLTVVADNQRDIYNALKTVIDLVDQDFSGATATAPCFTFDFAITDFIDPEREIYVDA